MDPQLYARLAAQNWPDIITRLTAHAQLRLKWFGIKSEKRLQGKEDKDFAKEAITLLYEGKRVWDFDKEPDLLSYLRQVVNSLIANLLKSAERRKLSDKDLTETMDDATFFQEMLEQKLINKDLLEKIENTLLDNENMWLVFTDLAIGMTPADIADKYGMDIDEIRNLQRKLKRHINNIKNL